MVHTVKTTAARSPSGRPPLASFWRTVKSEEARMGYLFIAPAVLLLLLFQFLPILLAFYLSFTNTEIYNIPGPFIGMKNYIGVVKYPVFWRSMLNAAIMTAINVPVGIFLSFTSAVLLNERTLRGRTLYRLFYLIPLTGSAVVSSMIWMWLYHPESGGILNSLLLSLGLIGDKVAWLGEIKTALPAVIFSSWWGFGFNMLIYLSAVQGIPESLYKAAVVDGAGRLHILRKITWPLVKPATFFLLINGILHIFEAGFTSVYVLTKGGPLHTTEVATHLIYQTGFGYNQLGYAAAMAFVLFLVSLSVTLILWPKLRQAQEMYV